VHLHEEFFIGGFRRSNRRPSIQLRRSALLSGARPSIGQSQKSGGRIGKINHSTGLLKMAKARKGFGFGGKNGGGKRRKKKVTISKSGWGSKEPEEKETSDRLPVAPPTYDVQELKIGPWHRLAAMQCLPQV
jgi:hypothetical protein